MPTMVASVGILGRGEGQRRFAAAAPVDRLTGSRAHRIEGDQGASLVAAPAVERLHDQQPLALERRVLDRANDISDHASEKHDDGAAGNRGLYFLRAAASSLSCCASRCTVSTMPMIAASTGRSLQSAARRAELPETTSTVSRKPGVHGVHGDDVAGLVGALGGNRFDDKQLAAFEARIFPRGDHRADDASQNHPGVLREKLAPHLEEEEKRANFRGG